MTRHREYEALDLGWLRDAMGGPVLVDGRNVFYSQGKTLDERMVNIREVIELCLEEEDDEVRPEFVGVQRVVV